MPNKRLFCKKTHNSKFTYFRQLPEASIARRQYESWQCHATVPWKCTWRPRMWFERDSLERHCAKLYSSTLFEMPRAGQMSESFKLTPEGAGVSWAHRGVFNHLKKLTRAKWPMPMRSPWIRAWLRWWQLRLIMPEASAYRYGMNHEKIHEPRTKTIVTVNELRKWEQNFWN